MFSGAEDARAIPCLSAPRPRTGAFGISRVALSSLFGAKPIEPKQKSNQTNRKRLQQLLLLQLPRLQL